MAQNDRDDREAITVLFNSLANALDRKDWDAYGALFLEDATCDFTKDFHRKGRTQIVAFCRHAVDSCGPTHHMLGNHTATVKGDTADAACHFRAYHAGRDAKAHLFEESLGIFTARVKRTPDGWRFSYLDENIMIMLGTPDVFPAEKPF
jgi:ketosteroid isomerase-like protein